jgi:two-component system, OmpR family, response regulator VicR
MKDVLTTGETAKYCGVNFRTIIRWIEKGYLEAYKLPGRGDNRIKKESLLRFMQENNMPIPEELSGQVPVGTTQSVAKSVSQISRNQEQQTKQSNKILVVEDESLMAKSIERTLLRAGYEVELASNGIEAGIKIEKFKPSFITLDIQMPGMNGVQVLQAIRENIDYKHIKVLIVSANADTYREQIEQHGVEGIIEKPFKSEELLSKLAHLR